MSQTSADLARGRMPSGSILVEIPNARPGEDGKLFGLASEANQRIGLLESPAAAQEPRSVWMLWCQLDAPDALTGKEHRRVTDRYRSVLAQASTRFGGRVLSVDQDIAILLFAKPADCRAGLWARDLRRRSRSGRRDQAGWLSMSSGLRGRVTRRRTRAGGLPAANSADLGVRVRRRVIGQRTPSGRHVGEPRNAPAVRPRSCPTGLPARRCVDG